MPTRTPELVVLVALFGGCGGPRSPMEPPAPAVASPSVASPSVAFLGAPPLVCGASLEADPLPPDTQSRIGTRRFRLDDDFAHVRFTSAQELVSLAHRVFRWDAASGARTATLDQDWFDGLSSNGRFAGGFDVMEERFAVVDLETGAERVLGRYTLDDGTPQVRISDDGETVVGFAGQPCFKLWLAGEVETRCIDGDVTTNAVMSADGRVLAATSGGLEARSLWMWRRDGEAIELPAPLLAPGIDTPSLAADGHLLAASTGEAVLLWNPAGGAVQTLPIAADELRLSPDGSLLAAIVGDGLELWELRGRTRRWRHDGVRLADLDNALGFSPDGERLAYAFGRAVRVVSTATGADTTEVGGPVGLRESVLSNDGRRVATVSLGWVAIWDADTGALIHSYLEPEARSIRFALGDAYLVGFRRAALTLWPVAPGGEIGALPGNYGDEVLALSPDGRIAMFSAGNPPDRVFYDLAERRELGRAASARDYEQAWVFSPDGTRLYAMGPEQLLHGDTPTGGTGIEVVDVATSAVIDTFVIDYSVQVIDAVVVPGAAAPDRLLLNDRWVDLDTHRVELAPMFFVAASPDAQLALVAREEGGNVIWRVTDPVGATESSVPSQLAFITGFSSVGRYLECDVSPVCLVRGRR